MAFWLILLLLVATTVVSALLQKHSPGAKASGIGDFQAPTAEEGRAIPVIFGTVKCAGPNVVWYGDLKAVPIKKKSGLFSHTVVGYKYYLGLDLAICHGPIDAFIELRAGQSPDDIAVPRINTVETADAITTFLNAPKLFGGEDKEGGLYGEVVIYKGTPTQTADPYLVSVIGAADVAEYTGLCRIVARGVYVGTSNYLKNWSPVLRRCPSNLGQVDAVTNINGDANGIEIIYECMTSTAWGLGMPPSRFNIANWQGAAQQVAAEGAGISMILDNPQSADQVIGDICRHLDCVVYTDPATGLWNVTLARNDYDPETLLEIGPDDIVEKPQFTRGSWEETLNEVKVKYIDRGDFKEHIVQAHESANLAVTNEVKSETIEFLGFSNAELAQLAAMRELKTHSYPLARLSAKVNRKAWALRMASPFRYTYPADGIDQLVMRVTNIKYGNLAESKIEIEAVEDVFAVAYAAFDTPIVSKWTDPNADASAPTAETAIESPYQMLPTTTAHNRVLVGAARADSISLGYEVWVDKLDGLGYSETNVIEHFCPSGLLVAPYPRTTAALDVAGFVLNTSRDLDTVIGTDVTGRVRGDCLVMFADTGEICAFQGAHNNGDGTFSFSTIVRGVFDTVPADHAAGSRVWVIRDVGITLLGNMDPDGQVVVEGGDGGDTFLVNGA
jgi:hypothetical protein